ncbi:MAG: hypothetical protein ABIP48_26420 [Planctomycetota bacterium]
MNQFRRSLEDMVLEVKGRVSMLDAALIQSSLRWERHGALAQRWLRLEGDKLKPMEKLAYSREIAKASSERDKALAAMDLDRDEKDHVLDVLYSRTLPAPNGDSDEPA